MRQPEICPTCHQVIAPEGLQLPRIKAQIYEAVRRRPGITPAALRDVLYGLDPNGGPESRTILHTHIAQLNLLLRPRGIEIRSSGGGYRVRSVS